MAPSNARDPPERGSEDLTGLRILVVEDNWRVGIALKGLLQSLGAEVAGPVATAAEAERSVSGQIPDAAFIDFELQDGELADHLIDSLIDRGIHVVVTSGYTDLPRTTGKAAVILEKPFTIEACLAALRPVSAPKAAR
jgi:CheY-like chemotaxis protein